METPNTDLSGQESIWSAAKAQIRVQFSACSHDVLLAAIGQSIERSRLALDREAESRELRNRYASLTPRERQVMALVVSGLLNKQVGGELGISEITVKASRLKVKESL